MVVRCTGKLLNLLGKQSVTLVDAPTSDDDWYANLIWVDRRKCLLFVHAGTLFSLFVADIRVSDLRPFERRIVDLLKGALLEEGIPIDALGRLEPSDVRLAKTASRHVLGVMNQMAFEIGSHVDQAGGLWNVDVDALNNLRRSLHTKDGDYRVPLELVHKRLRGAGNDLSLDRRRHSRRELRQPRPWLPDPNFRHPQAATSASASRSDCRRDRRGRAQLPCPHTSFLTQYTD